MGKTIKLTEADLQRLIMKVIKEEKRKLNEGLVNPITLDEIKKDMQTKMKPVDVGASARQIQVAEEKIFLYEGKLYYKTSPRTGSSLEEITCQ